MVAIVTMMQVSNTPLVNINLFNSIFYSTLV